MTLTPSDKERIDAMSYEALLRECRFAPLGDPMFQGESGDYVLKRMAEMRQEPGGQERHVGASKRIGWER